MAAYAAVVSLMRIIHQIQSHPRHSILLDNNNQIASLREITGFLQDFLESYSSSSSEAEALEQQIASAAHAAEDVIESHVADQILATGHHEEKGSRFLMDLRKVMQDMDDIKKRAMMKVEKGCKAVEVTYSVPAASSRTLLNAGKSTMVGFDDELFELMDKLTGQQPKRQVVSIVGMGGIGKTTLARNVYESSLIVQHFDIRSWVTVSQNYSLREILVELISCRSESSGEVDLRTEDELGEQLYKSLFGRRYLIVLDDVWGVETWDKIKFFFPDNNSRSRIIVTTRLSRVATHFGSLGLTLNFLDEDKSWKLFCDKVFAYEGCPPELEEIGRKIVKKCKGLPLSISVIGGILGKSYRTKENWENVAKDISSILSSGDDEHCLKILYLSYSHLPVHLKPCLLYMGIFPEDHEIRVSRLVKLWVAEGFLKPNDAKSPEEVAEGYLKDLVGRNLALVRRWRWNGQVKTCSIHDILRELCLTIAKKEKFLCVTRVLDTPQVLDKERRVVHHESIAKEYNAQAFHALQSASVVRSLTRGSGRLPFKPKLLRVPDVVDDSLEGIFQQVNLRYLACRPTWISFSELLPSISQLWNLQTIIIRGGIKRTVAPSEIWEMPQLRHLEFHKLCIPDPPSDGVAQHDFVLANLQTLLTVVNFSCSAEVCRRIPNIKKLHIIYDDFSASSHSYCLYHLHRLHKLESLNCFFYKAPNRVDLLHNLTFPISLKKLSLTNCQLYWEDLTVIGSLPNLEVLNLRGASVSGSEWNPVEGEFYHLKLLQISNVNLIHWTAESCHFPVLENLVLYRLFKLDEIPSGIGDISTLQAITLDCCSESAAISAMKILEEQDCLENDSLQIRVKFLKKADLESFREKVDLWSFTSNNLQVEVTFP